MMAQPYTAYPNDKAPGATAGPSRSEWTPPPMGDGFAPPTETLGCRDDLSDGMTPAGTGNVGLAGEPSAF